VTHLACRLQSTNRCRRMIQGIMQLLPKLVSPCTTRKQFDLTSNTPENGFEPKRLPCKPTFSTLSQLAAADTTVLVSCEYIAPIRRKPASASSDSYYDVQILTCSLAGKEIIMAGRHERVHSKRSFHRSFECITEITHPLPFKIPPFK
jgi:hypothetical protein